MLRRTILAAPAVALLSAGGEVLAARAGPAAPATADKAPLRCGVDRSLAASGLARALQQAFGADTGIGIKLVVAPALVVLDAVRDGELDAALVNAPVAETQLERQALVHDRRPIAVGDFLLVGPGGRGRTGGPAGRDTTAALTRIRDLAEAAGSTGGVIFLSPGDGSGAHVAEQAMWRRAGIEPKAPWYAIAGAGKGFAGQAQQRAAYALVERGEWQAGGGPPLAVVVEGDAALAEPVHAMRSFRAGHPAGKIFLAWIGGRQGRAVVARQRGYRAA